MFMSDRSFKPGNYYNKLLCLYALRWIDRFIPENYFTNCNQITCILRSYFSQKQQRPSLPDTLDHAKQPCEFILVSTVLNCLNATVYLPTVSWSNLFSAWRVHFLWWCVMAGPDISHWYLQELKAPPKSEIKSVFTSHNRITTQTWFCKIINNFKILLHTDKRLFIGYISSIEEKGTNIRVILLYIYNSNFDDIKLGYFRHSFH